eukprot:GGOE01004078.1.p1 GENE.GGOE01004078.1~~GGOE01004078.1.p1  ORF type:complete len:401 (+),score=51.96 GGOE01004078.1:55-1257(+)
MADRKAKELQKELHKRLEKQLAREENRLCFDCHEKGPKWASMNLGVFLCIRCAGIHRALGVHISKVRSTTMDNWEPQWVEFIENVGNERGKQIYEAKWTKNVERPSISTPDRQLDSHIREKYEARRWWSDPSLDDAAIQALARSWADASPTAASPASPLSPQPSTSAPPPAAAKPAVQAAAAKKLAPAPAPAAQISKKEEDLLMDFGEKMKIHEEEDFFSSKPQTSAPSLAAAAPGNTASLFPDTMGDFKSAPNKQDVKNNILNAFSAPAPPAMGAGMSGPPPLAGHMGMMGGMGGYQQGYGMNQMGQGQMGHMGMGMGMGSAMGGNMGNMGMGGNMMGYMGNNMMGNGMMGGPMMGGMANPMGMGMGMGQGMGNYMGMNSNPGMAGFNNNMGFGGVMQK